jgi:DNA polymerase I-like protein with 3'-5' exonuclease and polymerase domains
VELRVLAHLSGDPALCALLQRAGAGGDAFLHIAARWLGSGDVEHVSKEQREKAKRVTYGIIYGLTPYGLAQGSGALGISVQAAQVRYSALWCASVRVRARVGRVWNGLPWGPRGRLAWSA